MIAALALLQDTAFRTPDTGGQMRMGYIAIGLLLGGYLLFLWLRVRKAKRR